LATPFLYISFFFAFYQNFSIFFYFLKARQDVESACVAVGVYWFWQKAIFFKIKIEKFKKQRRRLYDPNVSNILAKFWPCWQNKETFFWSFGHIQWAQLFIHI
jgi:hypothetical protein